MFLRKSPLTPACLEANRHNAQKSIGPHMTRGKQVRGPLPLWPAAFPNTTARRRTAENRLYFTSEAIMYMKRNERCCKTNCRCCTFPDHQDNRWRRLRGESGGVARTTAFVVRGFSMACGRAADLEEQVCATRFVTSEAIKYMKTKHGCCKMNCRRSTLPDDRNRQRRRRRCELGG
jgi:hypothetical protein